MRKLLQFLLRKPLTRIADRFASKPNKENVYNSLTQLLHAKNNILLDRIKTVEAHVEDIKMIIFSDQHKGNKSWADDFNASETNYIYALQYYNDLQFSFVSLGDSEELWKFSAQEILKQHEPAFRAEAAFHPQRFYKTFGNHDLIWKNKLITDVSLATYFPLPLSVYEGILVQLGTDEGSLQIFLTHGHQGDMMSDSNPVSSWFVAHIWTPLQRYLRININSPSSDYSLRNQHNLMMYEWSSTQENLLLVTGHTHKPVFASGKYLDHPSNNIDTQLSPEQLKPTYFNTGCCCFSDGDITGIEIEGGFIRLVKWQDVEEGFERKVLEEKKIVELMKDMG